MSKVGDSKLCSACGRGTMTLMMVHVPEFVIDETKPVSSSLETYPAWVCSSKDCNFEQRIAEHELQA
jgi:hypothetical protein